MVFDSYQKCVVDKILEYAMHGYFNPLVVENQLHWIIENLILLVILILFQIKKN